ncbi:MAG: threonine synthase [Caldilineaceae bacterium]|nr:threonine synthase [Caldilineaceae bacterium]
MDVERIPLLIAYCPTSKFRAPAELSPLRCPATNDPLEYTNIPPFDPNEIDESQVGLWRYAAMLPVIGEGEERVTLGEGWTPLIRDRWGDREVFWKLDTLMPTGSYKDRGVSVMVNWLVRLGALTVVDDSSGNAGASLACYAARANLQATIYVPESAPVPKKAQIAIYGAELVEVPGPRDAASRAAAAASRMVKSIKYASHAWHPAFLLGQMTTAWEIWEQMGRRVPDWFIAPTGHGGSLLGTWRGFQHLQASGVTNKLPKLVAVQAEPYTPLYEAFHANLDKIEASTHIEKISADGIAISKPVRSTALLSALRCSQGTAVAVSEKEVLAYHERLAQCGYFVEPTSATVAAALDKIRPLIQPGETVVSVLTGHGLKNPPSI